jgi:iron-sulfur cluster repair protein YtfE (RIC family)
LSSDQTAGRPTALSDELRVLVRLHPRESWAGNAKLGGIARFWLERHEMFRRLDEIIRSGTETALSERTDAADLKPWLLQQLRWQLGGLEEHHQVEDLHYFPVFRRAEPRLIRGFDLLERDHEALHAAIEGIVERANPVLLAENSDKFRADLARFRDAYTDLGRELLRHLDDEEDLVIPLLLERGEHAVAGSA